MKNIRYLGNLLSITLDNDLTVMAYPTGLDVWIVTTDPTPGVDYVTTTIQKWGDLFNVISSDGSSVFAYPTNGDVWIVNGVGGVTGSPGSGDLTGWEWPMNTSLWMISSPFGPRTTPYVGYHYGIDITGSGVTGTPIWAISAGTVITSTFNTRAGNWCMISHPDGTRSQYMHMPTLPLVSVGDVVTKGQIIGSVGKTGDATGPHLHFQTQDTSNIAVDPILYMRARGHEFGEVQTT